MKIKSNLPTIFASRICRDRRDEDADAYPTLHSRMSEWWRSRDRSEINWEADGLELGKDSMRYSDEEVKRVTYNQDLVVAIKEYEMTVNADYFRERDRLRRDEVSSVEFCNFAKSFDYRTAKNYRELIPFLSPESIEKHYDFLIAKGLKRPVQAQMKRLARSRVSQTNALGLTPALSQFANNKIARSEI